MNGLLDDLLFRAAALRPGSPALIFQKETILYSKLAADVRRFAHALRNAGIGPGERVGIFLEKRPEAAVAIMGAAAADAVFVPANPALRPAQVAHVVKDCGIRLLVTSRSRMAELEDALAACPSLQRIVFVEDENAPPPVTRIPSQSLHRFLESGHDGEFSWPRGADTDMVGILYTSGSTGDSKGVMLSHRNFVARAKCVSEYLNLTADDRILHLPHYSFGFGLDQLFNGFHVGACGVLHNYVTPQALMKVLLEQRITGLAGVPTALVALTALDWPLEIREHLRTIAIAGGRMPEGATRSLRCLAPEANIYLMYGQTETLRSTFLAPSEIDRHPNSIGRTISVAKIHVVRPDGTLCEPNEPGELVQTGDTVALGYWNDPERTAQVFRPAPSAAGSEPAMAVWSGDIVTRDEDGRLYYVGRRDDLIKTSGYRVSPTEIEDVLYASGLVDAAAAVGVAHSELGQVVVAFVTTPGHVDLDRDSLFAYCRQQLPGYMLPHQIIHRDTLPLNANSKIDRRRLVLEYGEQLHDTVLERPRAQPEMAGSGKPALMSRALEFLGIRRRRSASVSEIFASAFNLKSVDDQKSFSSLGGDSLSYVDVSIGLEDYIGHVPENWENMSIHELEQIPRSNSSSTTIAPDVLLRAATILGVVAVHNRYSNLGGGPSLLFALSGWSFARFAWNGDPGQVRRSIFGTMMKVVIPTMLLMLMFFLGDGIMHWSTLLFYDNLVEAASPLFWEGSWFVQVLFQILLFMGILAFIPGVSSFGEKRPYAFGLALTVGGFLLHYVIAKTVHSPILTFGNLPQYFLWQFALGWLILSSKSQIQRVVTLLILLGCLGALTTIKGLTSDYVLKFHAPYWLILGTLLLLWAPSVPLPRIMAAPIVTIAKSTLFIYLFHWPINVVAFRWLGIHGGPLGIAIGVTGSLAVWALYESLVKWVRSMRGANRQTADVFG